MIYSFRQIVCHYDWIRKNGPEFKFFLHYIYVCVGCIQITPSIILSNITQLNIFLLYANFEKSTSGLHILLILSMRANFKAI